MGSYRTSDLPAELWNFKPFFLWDLIVSHDQKCCLNIEKIPEQDNLERLKADSQPPGYTEKLLLGIGNRVST